MAEAPNPQQDKMFRKDLEDLGLYRHFFEDVIRGTFQRTFLSSTDDDELNSFTLRILYRFTLRHEVQIPI